MTHPDTDDTRTPLDDVAVRVSPYSHPTTWAWDLLDELVALWCPVCPAVRDGDADTDDGDRCPAGHTGSTRRVIVGTDGLIVRGL